MRGHGEWKTDPSEMKRRNGETELKPKIRDAKKRKNLFDISDNVVIFQGLGFNLGTWNLEPGT